MNACKLLFLAVLVHVQCNVSNSDAKGKWQSISRNFLASIAAQSGISISRTHSPTLLVRSLNGQETLDPSVIHFLKHDALLYPPRIVPITLQVSSVENGSDSALSSTASSLIKQTAVQCKKVYARTSTHLSWWFLFTSTADYILAKEIFQPWHSLRSVFFPHVIFEPKLPYQDIRAEIVVSIPHHSILLSTFLNSHGSNNNNEVKLTGEMAICLFAQMMIFIEIIQCSGYHLDALEVDDFVIDGGQVEQLIFVSLERLLPATESANERSVSSKRDWRLMLSIIKLVERSDRLKANVEDADMHIWLRRKVRELELLLERKKGNIRLGDVSLLPFFEPIDIEVWRTGKR